MPSRLALDVSRAAHHGLFHHILSTYLEERQERTVYRLVSTFGTTAEILALYETPERVLRSMKAADRAPFTCFLFPFALVESFSTS